MIRTVVHFTDTTGFGGAEQALLHVLAGLDRRRWQPVLMHHPGPGIAPLLEHARRLNVCLWTVPPMPEGRQGAAHVPQLVRTLRAAHPAVFHAHLTYPLACKFGLMAAILARVPATIATLQLYMDVPFNGSTAIQQRLIAAGLDRFIAVSHEVARRMHETFRTPPKKLEVVHNGIVLDPFVRSSNSSLRSMLNGSSERPIVLTNARLDSQKGHRYLVEAAALVPEALFVLAGDGPERTNIEDLVRARGLEDRFVFLGYRNDIPDLLASCDLFVLPSLYEGLPLSILEAMAAGKPVISSNIGGTDEAVIHNQTGLLVPAKDPVALATAIRMLLADSALASRLAANGRARVTQEFSAETMVERVTRIYDHILSYKASRGRR
jgi:glycosyltransferase involved in cell wall biosynthesis